MSTIPSSLPSVPVAGAAPQHHHGRLSRSLLDLSSGAASASSASGDDPASGVDASGLTGLIARQNRLSALADAPAAATANTSAARGIGAQPSAALAGQANLSPDAAWSLLQS
jgi:hypothetical protein